MFNLSDQIANKFNLRGCGVREKINANKFLFDQYHQLKLIEPVKTKVISEVRFIRNFFGINTYILSNEATYFVGISISLRRDSSVHRFPHLFPARQGWGQASKSIKFSEFNRRMLIADSSTDRSDAI